MIITLLMRVRNDENGFFRFLSLWLKRTLFPCYRVFRTIVFERSHSWWIEKSVRIRRFPENRPTCAVLAECCPDVGIFCPRCRKTASLETHSLVCLHRQSGGFSCLFHFLWAGWQHVFYEHAPCPPAIWLDAGYPRAGVKYGSMRRFIR